MKPRTPRGWRDPWNPPLTPKQRARVESKMDNFVWCGSGYVSCDDVAHWARKRAQRINAMSREERMFEYRGPKALPCDIEFYQ